LGHLATINLHHVPGRTGLDKNALQLGFLTIQQDQQGYSGGYLVTNAWGRPLEFRLTTSVTPNKVQQLLYGPTLRPYICSDLLGKVLVEKAGAQVQLVITDCDAALELRNQVQHPVAWLAPMDQSLFHEWEATLIAKAKSYALLAHPKFPGDVDAIKTLLHQTEVSDLAEPFSRVREALIEARKMGALKAA
jgi:hypothetical protein